MGHLTFNKNPLNYNFSRNQMFVKITTDNYTESVNYGAASRLSVSRMFLAVLNDVLTIHWGSGAKTYTFKAATNIGANEIAHPAGGQTSIEYISQLANDLNTDATLTAVMSISASHTMLIFEGLTPGPGLDFAASGTTVTSGHLVRTLGFDDIQTVVRPNYRICVDVYCGADLLVSIAKEPENNTVEFDLQHYIDNHLEYDRPIFTTLGLQNKFFCTNVIKEFHYKISEVYGETPAVQASTVSGISIASVTDNVHTSNTHFVLKAGFDALQARTLPSFQFGYHNLYKPWLTRRTGTHKGNKFMRDWLYFLVPASLDSVSFSMRYTWSLNGVVTVVDDHSTSVPKFTVVAFPTVHYAHKFRNDQADKVVVELVDDATGTPFTDPITYELEEEYNLDETIFHFDNGDGGFDLLRCTGAVTQNSEIAIEVAERTLTADDTKFDGDEKVLNKRRTTTRTVFSGYKTADQLKRVEDFLLARNAFVYGLKAHDGDEDYDYLVPIIVTSSKLEYHRTNRNLCGYVIEYREALRTEITQVRNFPLL